MGILQFLARDLDKPAITSVSAMMWQALRRAGIATPVPGCRRLLLG